MTSRNITRGGSKPAEATPATGEPTKAELTAKEQEAAHKPEATPPAVDPAAPTDTTAPVVDPHAEPDLSDLEDDELFDQADDKQPGDDDLPEGGEPLAPALPAPTGREVIAAVGDLLKNDPALRTMLIRQLGLDTDKPASAEDAVKALGAPRKLVWLGEYYRGKGEERLRVEEHVCHFISPPVSFAPFQDDEKDPRPHAIVPEKVGELLQKYGFDRRTGAPQFAWAEDAPKHLGNPASINAPRRFARTSEG